MISRRTQVRGGRRRCERRRPGGPLMRSAVFFLVVLCAAIPLGGDGGLLVQGEQQRGGDAFRLEQGRQPADGLPGRHRLAVQPPSPLGLAVKDGGDRAYADGRGSSFQLARGKAGRVHDAAQFREEIPLSRPQPLRKGLPLASTIHSTP